MVIFLFKLFPAVFVVGILVAFARSAFKKEDPTFKLNFIGFKELPDSLRTVVSKSEHDCAQLGFQLNCCLKVEHRGETEFSALFLKSDGAAVAEIRCTRQMRFVDKKYVGVFMTSLGHDGELIQTQSRRVVRDRYLSLPSVYSKLAPKPSHLRLQAAKSHDPTEIWTLHQALLNKSSASRRLLPITEQLIPKLQEYNIMHLKPFLAGTELPAPVFTLPSLDDSGVPAAENDVARPEERSEVLV